MPRRVASLILLIIALATVVPMTAEAADRDVPLTVLSLRDRLLRDRTQLLNYRSDLNLRIVQFRGVLSEADKLLLTSSLSPQRYQDINGAKGRLTQTIFELQRRLDLVERALLDNNKDLANVDYAIQRYACLK